jgi:uncharacterized protein YdeI (YjbR/CyaY-like superfamily)
MSETTLKFETRATFREWLEQYYSSEDGIWIEFSKEKGSISIKADEALEEALCFGWIDGLMKKIDDKSYKKYFAQRRKNSKWSEKNKGIVDLLEKNNRMTDHGRAKVKEAHENGMWNASAAEKVSDDKVEVLVDLLRGHEPAFSNFMLMSNSIKTTYTKLYLDAKNEDTKKRRLDKIIDRLNQNLKPM